MKEGDFVLVEFTAYDQEGNIFDSTKGDVAKQLYGKEGPLLVVYGRQQVIQGLKEAIENLKPGEEKEFEFPPEKAFGDRKKELLRIMKTSDFHKNRIAPKPGLPVEIDDGRGGKIFGKIKSVTGGRVLVDFNHPLAGQKVRYRVKLVEVITEPRKKIEYLIKESKLQGNVEELKEGKVVLKIKKEDKKDFSLRKTQLPILIKSLIPEIKDVEIREE